MKLAASSARPLKPSEVQALAQENERLLQLEQKLAQRETALARREAVLASRDEQLQSGEADLRAQHDLARMGAGDDPIAMAEKFEDVLKRYEALRSQVAALQRSHEEAIGRAKSAEGALSDAISRAEIAEKEAFSSNARPDEPLDAKEVDRLESRVRFLESELQAATLRCADERSNDVARALQQMAPAQSDDTYLVSIMSRELRAAEEAMAAAEGRCDQSEAARESLRSQTAQLLQQDAQEASVVQVRARKVAALLWLDVNMIGRGQKWTTAKARTLPRARVQFL
eukprot:874946-Pleurochrysis_carterae.AAC.2